MTQEHQKSYEILLDSKFIKILESLLASYKKSFDNQITVQNGKGKLTITKFHDGQIGVSYKNPDLLKCESENHRIKEILHNINDFVIEYNESHNTLSTELAISNIDSLKKKLQIFFELLEELNIDIGTDYVASTELSKDITTIERVDDVILKSHSDDYRMNPNGSESAILNDANRGEINTIFTLLSNISGAQANGVRIPKGYIFQGVPGVGKTYLMKELASDYSDEIDVFSISLQDFDSLWVSMGPKKLKSILNAVEESSKESGKHSIVFLDEFDDLGKKRESQSDHKQELLNVLLRFIDGLDSSEHITFICATNFDKSYLDPALLRAGRIEGHIKIDLPDEISRSKLFKQKIEQRHGIDIFELEISFDLLGKLSKEMTGADIEKLVNDTCIERFVRKKFSQGEVQKINTRLLVDKMRKRFMSSPDLLNSFDKTLKNYKSGNAFNGNGTDGNVISFT